MSGDDQLQLERERDRDRDQEQLNERDQEQEQDRERDSDRGRDRDGEGERNDAVASSVSTRRLHISNLPFTWTNGDAQIWFGACGTVTDAVVFRDERGRARFGFVELSTSAEAAAALERTQKEKALDVFIVAKYAVPKTPVSSPGSNPCRLFVSNIGYNETNDNVRREFERFGTLTDCSTWTNLKTAVRPGSEAPMSAFVHFQKPEEAAAAKQAMHGANLLRGGEAELAQRKPEFVPTPPLIVDFAKPKPESKRLGGGYGGRRFDDRDNRRFGDRRYDDRRRFDDRPRYDDRARFDDRRRYDDRDHRPRADDRDRYAYERPRYDDRAPPPPPHSYAQPARPYDDYRHPAAYSPDRERERDRDRDRDRYAARRSRSRSPAPQQGRHSRSRSRSPRRR